MPTDIETVTLTKIRIGMTKLINERLIHDAKFDISQWLYGKFKADLSGYLLGEDMDKREVSYPADWWQHFKKDKFPKWLLKRYPVKTIVEVMDAKILYTEYHNKVSLPEEPHIVSLSKWSYDDEETYAD